MNAASRALTPPTAPMVHGTLRAAMHKRAEASQVYSLRELVAIIVPLCTELASRHERGQRLIVTPSAIRFEIGSPTQFIDNQPPPTHPKDRACLPPELRGGGDGDARSTVFSVGAIAYEMLTGESVGPGMRRPSDIIKSLPAVLDTILSKALVGDYASRPNDLNALAQAIHGLVPTASVAPPESHASGFDAEDEFEVDVSLSMMPPPIAPDAAAAAVAATSAQGVVYHNNAGFVAVAEAPKGPAPIDPTSELAALRSRLEADPRPRYVVIKDGMDHGPFNAVELLQQIASHTFEAPHILVDTFSRDERPISDWPEFAPFAEHARLNRQIVAEKKEIEQSVIAEAKSTKRKALFIGGSITLVAALGAALWFVAKPQERTGDIVIDGHSAVSIEFDGGLKSSGSARHGDQGSSGSGRPVLGGGMSCEQAMNTYITELKMAGGKPDLTNGQLGARLNNGSYVSACGAPFSMTVNICAAIQNGRAVGVTVTTDPSNPGIASCIAGRVRSMSFPSHSALDVTRTVFKGQ